MATVKVTPAMVEQAMREVNWEAQDRLGDAEIARQVGEDPDVAPLLTEAEATASRLRTIRDRLGLSQVEFARRFHLSAASVRDWEQGRRRPDPAARVLLRVIEREPEAVLRALR